MDHADVNTNSCCKTCNDCPGCYDHRLSKIEEVLYAVNYKLSENLEQTVCEMRWGYSQKKPIAKNRLYVYRRALKTHIDALRNGYPTCLCPNEIQTILEAAQSIVGLSCCKDPQRRDLIIDKSGQDEWNLLNTSCVVYEEWEKSFRKACPTLGIRVEKVTTLAEVCKLVYTISTSTLDKCSVMYAIKAYSINTQENCYDVVWTAKPVECDLTVLKSIRKIDLDKCLSYGLTVEQAAECKLAYNLLIKQTKCNLDFGTYVSLLACNMTTDIIAKLVSCGLTVSYDAKKLCPVLTVGTTSVHLYNDLDLSELTEDIFSCDFNVLDL